MDNHWASAPAPRPTPPQVRPEWNDHLVAARTHLLTLATAIDAGSAEDQDTVAVKVFQGVKDTVQAQITALDSTARIIGSAVLNREVKRLPYYPKVKNEGTFPVSLQSQLPGLARDYPTIAEAFERHQPFQSGKRYLALLFDLATVRRATNLPLESRPAENEQEAGIYLSGPNYAGIQVSILTALEKVQDLVEDAVTDVTTAAGLRSPDSKVAS